MYNLSQVPLDNNLLQHIIKNSTHICRSPDLLKVNTKRTDYPNEIIVKQPLSGSSKNAQPIRAPNMFDPVFFLNLIRDRKMGVMGDSLSLQLYHSITNHLFQYETSQIKTVRNGSIALRNNDFSHKISYYKEFNTSKLKIILIYL
jgi:hypothetical protein